MLKKLLMITFLLWIFSLSIFIGFTIGYSLIFSIVANYEMLLFNALIFSSIISFSFIAICLVSLLKK
jgi:hypothetical protein